MRIDSHHHFWNYSADDYPWIDPASVLKRDYGAEDLKAELDGCGIDGVISVQARQTLDETRWLCELASRNAWIRGVVGWVPLASTELEQELEQLKDDSKLKSVRHVVQDEPDDGFILGSDFNRGIGLLKQYDLVYDILIFAKHLTNTIEFVDRHPSQPFVLDHIAKPTIQLSEFDQAWEQGFRELAKRDNVACKFSGVATEIRDEHWNVESIKPYWDVALDAFGPGRLMIGSDWPVCRLKVEYQAWIAMVESFVAPLSADEQNDIWCNSAIKAYRLDSN